MAGSPKKNAVRASHPNRIADVNLSLTRPRFPPVELLALQRPVVPASAAGGASASEDAQHLIMPGGLQSRYARPFLRRPQRPGCPQRLHALGTAQQLTGTAHSLPFGPPELVTFRLLQNQPCTITGSAMFTSAVSELSRICNVPAMKIRGAVVQNLWTGGLPCGKTRKSRKEIGCHACHSTRGSRYSFHRLGRLWTSRIVSTYYNKLHE